MRACPFCRSEAVKHQLEMDVIGRWTTKVVCVGCGASGPKVNTSRGQQVSVYEAESERLWDNRSGIAPKGGREMIPLKEWQALTKDERKQYLRERVDAMTDAEALAFWNRIEAVCAEVGDDEAKEGE